jgi:hypothetical protein
MLESPAVSRTASLVSPSKRSSREITLEDLKLGGPFGLLGVVNFDEGHARRGVYAADLHAVNAGLQSD